MHRFILAMLLMMTFFAAENSRADSPCPPQLSAPSGEEPSTICGTPATLVTGYFVDPVNGSDSNNGTNPQNAWKSLSKVAQSFGREDRGIDVWLRSGTVFEDQTLYIDWSGTQSDKAIVGCYFLRNNEPYRCNRSHPKPEVNGTFDESCRLSHRNGTPCYPFAGTGSTVSGAVPYEIYSALIQVVSSNSLDQGIQHVTVENLALKDSAGVGIHTGNWSRNITVRGMEIGYVGNIGIQSGYGSMNVAIQDNTVHHTIFCSSWYHAASHNQDLIPDNCVRDYAAAITIAQNHSENSSGTWTIVENNDVYHSHGEGIGCNFSSRPLIRGNRIRDTRKNAIYIAACPRARVESNIIWSSAEVDADFGDYDVPAAIAVHVETDLPGYRDTTQNVIRNNVIAAAGKCFEQSAWWLNGKLDVPIGAKWVNNTCVQPTEMGARMHPSSAADDATYNLELIFENNIVYAPGVTVCNSVTNVASKSYRNNFWNAIPSDRDCQDDPSTDIVGKPNLARDADSWGKSNWTVDKGPSFSDAVLISGAGLGAGKSQQTEILDFTEYSEWGSLSYPFVPSGAEWNKTAAYDSSGNLRSQSNPNIGADETN